jgi:copper transport protein
VFSEPIEGNLGRIALIGGDRRTLALSPAADPHDVHALIAPVGTLAPGDYTLTWRVVSADGHLASGSFVFTVASSAAPVPSVAVPPPVPTAAPPAPAEADTWGPSLAGAPVVSALLRGVGLACLMAATGLLLCLAMTGAASPRAMRVAVSTSLAAVVLLAAHYVAWLVNTAADHRLSLSWFSATLSTNAGAAEVLRVSLALLGFWAIALARRPSMALAFAGAALVASGAIGHPAAIQPVWAIPSKALHLLAASAWLGGLLWLVLRESTDVDRYVHEASRVSSIALTAVIVMAFSGSILDRVFLDSWPALVQSNYGLVSLAKIGGLLVLVGFGAYHRYRVLPRLSATSVSGLKGSVRVEVAVMLVVVLLGGWLAYIPPPHG